MEIPGCMNFKEGSCPKSDVYISRETDTAFVFTCRTCKSANVWPKVMDENAGRHAAFLKSKAAREAQERYESLRKSFSYEGERH